MGIALLFKKTLSACCVTSGLKGGEQTRSRETDQELLQELRQEMKRRWTREVVPAEGLGATCVLTVSSKCP